MILENRLGSFNLIKNTAKRKVWRDFISHQTLVPKYPKSETFSYFLGDVDVLDRSFRMTFGRGHVPFTLRTILPEYVLSVC